MRPLARPLLEVALVHGMLGWLYAAACAAVDPAGMSLPVALLLPMRRDTFGICCFALSALAFFLLQDGRGRFWRPRRSTGTRLDAALRTVVCFALLTWVYLVVNSFTHPVTLARQLTHLARVPTEGTAAVLCFAGSAVALLLLRARRTDRPVGEPR